MVKIFSTWEVHMLVATLLAFIGSSMINVGQAIQKIGLNKEKRNLFIWTIGMIMNSGAVVFTVMAVNRSSASLVGAMAGSGLASLTLFSIFVMKEKVTLKEILGVVTILLGGVFIGLFSVESQAVINYKNLYIYIGIITVVYTALIIIFNKKDHLMGIIIGAFGGATGGFVTLFQKVSNVYEQANQVKFFQSPWAYVWIIMSVLSFVIIQFAYKRDQAIRIIPAFSSHFIIVPVLGGVLCFSEILSPLQWLGVGIILAGVLLITIKGKENSK